MIEVIHKLVEFKDLHVLRSLVGTGQFKLAATHKQFTVNRSVSVGKTQEKEDKHYKQFVICCEGSVNSNIDGESNELHLKQRVKNLIRPKEKNTERTFSVNSPCLYHSCNL